jgi:hypothetical protein
MISVILIFTADITTDKEHIYKYWSIGLFFIQNRIYQLEDSHKTGALENCVKMLPAVYIPLLLSFSLAKYFFKIKILLLQLLIGTLDGAVVISVHNWIIVIIHWHNPSGKSITLGP